MVAVPPSQKQHASDHEETTTDQHRDDPDLELLDDDAAFAVVGDQESTARTASTTSS